MWPKSNTNFLGIFLLIFVAVFRAHCSPTMKQMPTDYAAVGDSSAVFLLKRATEIDPSAIRYLGFGKRAGLYPNPVEMKYIGFGRKRSIATDHFFPGTFADED
uniref:GDSL esterase/lipase n=1 Tax=Globodera rostochiensis TaxID=31243 RepID=A0A914HZ01_GLORO